MSVEPDGGASFGNLCVAWADGDGDPEQLTGTAGVCHDGSPSRFCRQALFKMWRSTLALVHGSSADAAAADLTYAAAKAASPAFVQARAVLLQDPVLFGAWCQDDAEQFQAFR